MSVRLQIILLVLFILIFLFLVNQVKRKVVTLKYALAWLFLDIALIVLATFPDSLQTISKMLGISTPVNMIFFFGFVLALVIIYTLTVAMSRNSDRIRDLAQKIALNEYRTKNEKSR